MAPTENTGGDELLWFGSVPGIFEKIRSVWLTVHKYSISKFNLPS